MGDPRIGILYLGDMGAAWTRLLMDRGVTVVTAAGRSEATAIRARDLGVEILPSIEEVARQCDIVVSLVVPEAAEEMGLQVAEGIRRAGSSPIFVECNATSPDRAERIAVAITGAGADYVDGCVIGPASRLNADWSVCYLSGPRAQEVATVLGDAFPVHVLDDGVTTVSAFKMGFASFNRGLGSLLAQTFIMADRRGVLDHFLDYLYRRYPDLMRQMDYYVPGLPTQASRRVGEMYDVAATMEASGIRPSIVMGAVDVLNAIAEANLQPQPDQGSDRENLKAAVRQIGDSHVLDVERPAEVVRA